jgi:hypothetical protein
LLRPARPCSFDGRAMPGTATGDRGRNAALATAPPAAPSVASGPDHPWRSGCAVRSKLAGITTPQFDFERVVGRVSVCSRLCSSFRALFRCEGLRSWSGLGSVGVGGPPRVDPYDA